MYVNQIDVTGFRGVKECEEPIDLSDFTILVGRNNAGKSSLLEALYTCFGGQDPISGGSRATRVGEIHNSELLYRYSGEGEIVTVTDSHRITAQLTETGLSQIEVKSRTRGRDRTFSRPESSNGNLIEYTGFDKDETTMLLSPSYESYISILDRTKTMRDRVEIADIHTDVAEFINQQVDDEYTEIYLETLEARKQPETGSPFYVDIADLGSGVLKTIGMYLAVETLDPAILVWDDMGTSLHPGLLSHVMEWLAEKDVQVVASTHSIDALSTFLNVGVENGSVVQVSKSQDDVVSHTTLDMAELELVMDNAGLDPRFLTDEFELSDEVEA